jgi:hypothetical protein
MRYDVIQIVCYLDIGKGINSIELKPAGKNVSKNIKNARELY